MVLVHILDQVFGHMNPTHCQDVGDLIDTFRYGIALPLFHPFLQKGISH